MKTLTPRPQGLCAMYCRPGSPCPWCVQKTNIDAWALANQWEAAEKKAKEQTK